MSSFLVINMVLRTGTHVAHMQSPQRLNSEDDRTGA